MKITFERPHKKEVFEATIHYMAEQLAKELERITDLNYKEALQITSFWVQGTKVPNRPVKVMLPQVWKEKSLSKK